MNCMYFSSPELAHLTGYSRMQIQRLARARRIPSMRMTRGGHFRFKNDVMLQKWIRRCRKPLKSHIEKNASQHFSGRRANANSFDLQPLKATQSF